MFTFGLLLPAQPGFTLYLGHCLAEAGREGMCGRINNRTILSEQEVLEIYAVKNFNRSLEFKQRVTASSLAQKYNVGIKVIRNIWSGRTWADETRELRRFSSGKLNLNTEFSETSKVEPAGYLDLGKLNTQGLPYVESETEQTTHFITDFSLYVTPFSNLGKQGNDEQIYVHMSNLSESNEWILYEPF